ncbi:S26 family signal peptidase [Halogeometricum limi]|uniref:Signal peptidase, endoplasmic reticulum-type n=1 Tax=Halogeometricum limi TaxID=555875 RepID=A0A1I6FR74_9EURY|nr:S26 family signal peptidase [Halogeometricum limi]SFR32455.1 signal peptidase, endoplasmic reticulum-type [Halogeometricum limi]
MNDDQGETGVDDAPRPEPDASNRESSKTPLHRLLHAQDGVLLFVREVLVSVSAVVALGLLLFAISGVWPPMVAVESGSMEPEMYRGDLVFITAPDRFTPGYAFEDTGIVTVDIGTEEGYTSFGGAGSVVVFDPPSRIGSPIIHRAHFHVEKGENWYDKANPDYINAENCEELRYCPAPHAGFITKGDANARYDQASNIAEPVRPEWIEGVARLRVPYLGYVRLELAGMLYPSPVAAESLADENRPASADPLGFGSTTRTVGVA